jgi:type IV secretory pathway TraG/TraD family ATPase VirD4
MVAADIASGHGVGLIDPHGDLAEQVLAAVPPQRTNDVVVFDPGDPTYAVGFNPLACHDVAKRDLVADDVVSAFSRIYDLSQTPRLKDTLRNALYVLVEQGETLVSLLMLLSDEGYRERIVNRAEDELARLFWTREFAGWNERYRTEALSAIQNKVRPFLMNRSIRAIVGQKGRTLDLRKVMDDGKVLVANLSKGRIGEDNANLLGALLVSTLQQAAMSRADVPEEQRRDFFLTVDEFQNYRTGSFASILSEARKYRLCLTVAHQYLKQLDEETSNAVFGNVGSLVSFQVSGDDAEILARSLSQFPGQVRPADLANLPKYRAYARLLIDGMPSRPFSLQTLPPPSLPCPDERRRIVRESSGRRHAAPAERVHAEIRRAFENL